MVLSEAISEFILEQRVRGNSNATVSYYRNVLGYFLEFSGNVDVTELTLHRCREYYLQLAQDEINSVSVQSYIRGLRAFLRWLYDNEYITENICAKFKLPKATRKVIDVLTEEEIALLFDSILGRHELAVRNRLIVALMLDCGLRRHEVVTLTVSAVHLRDRYIIVQQGKGDKQRVVPFGKFTAKLVERYLKLTAQRLPREALIIKLSGDGPAEGITDTTLIQLFRKLKKRTGIYRLKPHLLRHTFATRYLENGGNIYSLQQILGHTSLDMVKRYLHLANTRIRKDFSRFSPLDNLK